VKKRNMRVISKTIPKAVFLFILTQTGV